MLQVPILYTGLIPRVRKLLLVKFETVFTRVVDPDWLNTDPDPDPAFLLNPDTDSVPDPS
jgi:hypothetical protein